MTEAKNRWEPCEKCGHAGEYCAHYPRPASCFAGRVNLAIDCLTTGNGIGSRTFDNCFEMFDGDFVVVMLHRLAKKDARLQQGIAKHLCAEAGAAAVTRLAHLHTSQLDKAAAAHRKREREYMASPGTTQQQELFA
jgi:hypothetical protein